MKGRLTSAQTTRSKTISCEGQRAKMVKNKERWRETDVQIRRGAAELRVDPTPDLLA